MRQTNKPGFTLFIVIIFLVLIGLFLSVLGNASKNFLRKTAQLQLKTNCIQLLASADAWAKQNAEMLSQAESGKLFELDTTAFTAKDAICTAKIIEVNDTAVTVQLFSSCKKGRLVAAKSKQRKIVPAKTNDKPVEQIDIHSETNDIKTDPNDIPSEKIISPEEPNDISIEAIVTSTEPNLVPEETDEISVEN